MISNIRVGSRRLGAYSASFLLLAILEIFQVCGNAQSTQTGDTNIINNPSIPIPGAGHNLIPGLNDSVNPADGTVNISIQIPVPAGRGLTLPFAIQYSSSNTSHMAGTSGNAETVLFDWTPISGFMSMAGWSYTLPSMSYAVGGRFVGTVRNDSQQLVNAYCYYTSHYLFSDPHGASFPQSLSLVASAPYSTSGSAGLSLCSFYDLPSTYYSSPGQYVAILNKSSVGPVPSNGNATNFSAPLSATVTDPDGTVYDFNSPAPHPTSSSLALAALPDFVEDRNGNKVNITDSLTSCNAAGQCSGSVSVTDTLQRPVLTINGFGSSGNTVSVYSLPKPYTITWDTPQNVNYPITLTSENPSGNTECVPSSSGTQYPSFGPGISKIALPDGTAYTFEYDPTYGYISKITYPNGGYVAYTYDVFPGAAVLDTYTGTYGSVPPSQASCVYRYDRAALHTRTVSFDGSSVALTQSFTYDTNWSEDSGPGLWTSKVTTVTTTDAINNLSYTTTYTYSEAGSLGYATNDTPTNGTQATGIIPLEQTIQYSDFGGTPLETVTKAWLAPNFLACEMDTYTPSGAAQTSGKFYTWAAIGIPSDVREYDFGVLSPSVCMGTNGAPPATPKTTPTRETISTLQTFNPSPIYYEPAGISALPTIQDRPCKTVVKASGTEVAETDYLYDGGSSVCGAAGSPSVVSASVPARTHDETNFSATSTNARGNATTITQQCFGCTSSTSTYTYDETGQVVSVTDPRHNTTTYSYADSYAGNSICPPGTQNPAGNSNAYLTQISNPLGQTQNFSYDYVTGEMTCSTDENKQSTGYSYNDPFNRLTNTIYPDQGSVTLTYNDAVPSVTTTKLQTPNPTVTSVSIMDGLGHLIQTQTSEPNGSDVVSITYDGLGRVYKQTNPFLSSSSPSSSFVSMPSGTPFITNYYDSMSRPVETVEQDGNALQWCYNGMPSSPVVYCSPSHLGSITTGTWVDLTDENGNHRQRTSDSFGRLTEVIEPNGTNQTSSMETDYSYNGLNDLMSVKQCGALCTSPAPNGPISRSFSYDSLSRLIQAFNPETGWLCYGTLSSGSVPNGSNCNEGYDANGNLTAKTDGRGFVNSYTYDALNRETLETSTAPNTYSHYFYYDQTSLFGTTFVNPIGHLTLTTTSLTVGSSSFVGATSIFPNYDAMGRLREIQECTPATCNSSNIAESGWYSLSGTYDLAGNLTSYTDGFQTTITSSYNSAGRLSSVSSNQNGGTTLWTANTYSPIGLTKATFGNGAVDTLAYDQRERLQSTSIVNSSGGPIYSEGLSYYPNSNVNTANDSVNGNWTYTYDTLNRLSTALASNTGQNCAFGYDPFGNFKSELPGGSGSCFSRSFTFSTATNHIDGYCYDAAGNLVDAGPCPQSGSNHQNFYDGWGHLLSANFNLSPATSYTVDSLDRRVSKFTGSSLAHQYLYGVDGNPVAEMDGSGNWLQTNIRAGGQFLAEVLPSGIAYLYHDHLGTIRAETGAVTGTCTSLPFGDALNCSGNTDPSGYHFTGKERDSESGNDYFINRYYGSSMGRFLSADPSGLLYADPTNPQSLNLYSYVLNNPLAYVDPDGLSCYWDDGSHDSAPSDGGASKKDCGKQGGTWIDEPTTFVQVTANPDNNDTSTTSITISTELGYQQCSPSQFKVTGIGPKQAPGPGEFSPSRRPPANNEVAIKPQNFGVPYSTKSERNAAQGKTVSSVVNNIVIFPNYGTASTPKNVPQTPFGAPSGPYQPAGVIGPADVRNSPGNQIDVYRYDSQQDALRSTRTTTPTIFVPINSSGVGCPQ